MINFQSFGEIFGIVWMRWDLFDLTGCGEFGSLAVVVVLMMEGTLVRVGNRMKGGFVVDLNNSYVASNCSH